MENQIQVGFGRRQLIPEASIPLGGYGNERERFHDTLGEPVCVSCVAVTDAAGETVLMFGTDFCSCSKPIRQQIQDRINEATGVPQEHIVMSATHTHASISTKWDDIPSVPPFKKQIIEKSLEAALEAMEDRKPATMRTGSIETHNLNFVKHYKVQNNETGAIEYAGDQFGTFKNRTILEHATPVDPTMHLLQFVREDAKDIVLCNFRAHPHFHSGYKATLFSSDYIGAYRRSFELITDCYTVFFQGACGNTNATTRIAEERRYSTAESYGIGLAAAAVECLKKNMEDVEAGPIRTTCKTFRGPLWNETADKIESAKYIRDLWFKNYDSTECKREGAPLGIRSSFHARSIIARTERVPEDGDILTHAVSIGDNFAFVTYPGEMFDTLSVRIEEGSPFPMTMMLGYCQDHLGYLPSAIAYEYTSYETDSTRFAPGTGEQVADFQIQMLKELKNN